MFSSRFRLIPISSEPTVTPYVGSSYAYEALLINEFSGRYFACSDIVPSGPGYPDSSSEFTTCSTQGSVPGSLLVLGDDFIRVTYNYRAGNKWRQVESGLAIRTGH